MRIQMSNALLYERDRLVGKSIRQDKNTSQWTAKDGVSQSISR